MWTNKQSKNIRTSHFASDLRFFAYVTFKFISSKLILKLKSMSWNLYLKVTRLSLDFKWDKKLNLLKALPTLTKTRFWRFFRISDFFVKNKSFYFLYLKSKHKIYILSENVIMRICRPYLGIVHCATREKKIYFASVKFFKSMFLLKRLNLSI